MKSPPQVGRGHGGAYGAEPARTARAPARGLPCQSSAATPFPRTLSSSTRAARSPAHGVGTRLAAGVENAVVLLRELPVYPCARSYTILKTYVQPLRLRRAV